MEHDLQGKVALVTGATSYIGKAIAQLLAAHGALVVVNGRNAADGEAAVREITAAGGTAHFEQADLLDPEQVRQMADRVAAQLGRIDILVASGAGASADSPSFKLFHEMEPADYDAYIRAHWLTRAYAIRAVYPHMRNAGGGKMIMLATDAGRVATVGESFIGGSTAGMMQMCRSLAREFGRDHIRVNAVSLSFVTDAVPRWAQASPALQPKEGGGVGSKLRDRMLFDVTQHDIAAAVAFLAGPGGDAITGQTLSVNGGISTPG